MLRDVTKCLSDIHVRLADFVGHPRLSSGEKRMTNYDRYPAYPDYRPSGVEWLGEIPSHWKVLRIKQLAKQGYRTFVDGDWIESPYITDEGIRLIQTGNIGIGEYREQGFRYIAQKTFVELDCTEVIPSDVLVCRLAEPVGRACLAPDLGCRMITSVDVCILKPNRNHDSQFIVYSLFNKAYLNWLDTISRGSTRNRISRTMLSDTYFIAPPLNEQRVIADFLDRETAPIDLRSTLLQMEDSGDITRYDYKPPNGGRPTERYVMVGQRVNGHKGDEDDDGGSDDGGSDDTPPTTGSDAPKAKGKQSKAAPAKGAGKPPGTESIGPPG